MRLYQAVIEWVEARAEHHRENVAARFLDCRCGTINDSADCD